MNRVLHTMTNYTKFLEGKTHAGDLHGFSPIAIPDMLFPFQVHLTDWAIRKGRAALWEGCGTGKSCQELVWADNVIRKTNRPVLLLTPLAVGPQMVSEGEKFGIECKQTAGKVYKGINVTNYQKLHLFNPTDFAAVVCDESSAIKAESGQTRKRVTKFLRKVKYALLATATPSPNDWMELGTSAEALGIMTRNQMLGMFFSNGGESTQQWELKGHARKRFWRWICDWARAIRQPSDLGFSDEGYILPELETIRHVVDVENRSVGRLGLSPAVTLDQQREERKATLKERCEKVVELIATRKPKHSVVWCHLNDEGDLLEKMIPDAVNVQGSDSDEVKEERLTAFSRGQIKVLITKPKIGGWGLNWQHCCHMTSFLSHSFESQYQAFRRCWRFGQKNNVIADIVTTQRESRVWENLRRKGEQMETMFSELVEAMSDYQKGKNNRNGDGVVMQLPSWLLQKGS